MTIVSSNPRKWRFLKRNSFAKYQSSFLLILRLYSTYNFSYVYKIPRVTPHKISCQNCRRKLEKMQLSRVQSRFLSYVGIVTILRYGSVVIWSQRSIDGKFFLHDCAKESQVTIHQKNQIRIISMQSKHER